MCDIIYTLGQDDRVKMKEMTKQEKQTIDKPKVNAVQFSYLSSLVPSGQDLSLGNHIRWFPSCGI